jgi:hypothetical protein
MIMSSCSSARYKPSFENINGTVHACNGFELGSSLYVNYKNCNDMELGRKDVKEVSLWYKYDI